MTFHKSLLFLLILFISLGGWSQVLPENIGSTQYGTGHLAAAQKYARRISKYGEKNNWDKKFIERVTLSLEKLLCTQTNKVGAVLKSLDLSPKERKKFLGIIPELQKMDQGKVAQLLLIGKNRAVATDGHHRVRTMVKMSEVLSEANKLWPKEVKYILAPYERVRPNGELVLTLPLLKADVLDKLPENARARDVMRSILSHKMGLWSDPKDDALATSFYGKEKSMTANGNQLDHLARKLGIIDGPKGVTFIPIAKLPDSPMRTLMGSYFSSRGLKNDEKISYKAYVEFYLGDDVKVLVTKNPKKYPILYKILVLGSSVEEQKRFLTLAMEEMDKLFALHEALILKTMALTQTGAHEVENLLFKMKVKNCKKFSILPEKD